MATCSECTYMDFNKEHDNDGKYTDEVLEKFGK